MRFNIKKWQKHILILLLGSQLITLFISLLTTLIYGYPDYFPYDIFIWEFTTLLVSILVLIEDLILNKYYCSLPIYSVFITAIITPLSIFLCYFKCSNWITLIITSIIMVVLWESLFAVVYRTLKGKQ